MPQETRDKIVEAAYQTLCRLGYEATSVKDIAAGARIAPGLVHYYFKTKEDLVVAAIAFGCRQDLDSRDLDPTSAAWSAFEDARLKLEQRGDFHRLLFDMIGVSMHSEAVRAALVAFFREDRSHVEEIARAVLAQREAPAEGAPAIAAAVWGGIFGIVLQKLIDPELDADAALTAFARMVMTSEV